MCKLYYNYGGILSFYDFDAKIAIIICLQKSYLPFCVQFGPFFHLKAGKPAILSSYFTSLAFFFIFGKLFDDYQMKSQKPLNKAVTVTFSIGI